jgi:N-acetylmuramoyl-L-alanine amidase
MRVVVNPGHSTTDPGAIGPTGLTEAEVVRAVAQRLVALSDSRLGYEPKRQAGTGTGLSVLLKTLCLNPPDLLVSIHCNAGSRTLDECHVYWWREDSDARRRLDSSRLAGLIAIQVEAPEHRIAKRGRVLSAPYARADDPHFVPGILRYTAKRAVVLVELGFITNPMIETAMATDVYQQHAAEALDAAIREWSADFIPA